jgi:hypothetical protein
MVEWLQPEPWLRTDAPSWVDVSLRWEEGVLTVTLERLHIHACAVVRGARWSRGRTATRATLRTKGGQAAG